MATSSKINRLTKRLGLIAVIAASMLAVSGPTVGASSQSCAGGDGGWGIPRIIFTVHHSVQNARTAAFLDADPRWGPSAGDTIDVSRGHDDTTWRFHYTCATDQVLLQNDRTGNWVTAEGRWSSRVSGRPTPNERSLWALTDEGSGRVSLTNVTTGQRLRAVGWVDGSPVDTSFATDASTQWYLVRPPSQRSFR